MRHWQAPEQADILVSELLGSFGDNELSPECLDGAQSFLKPGGISIPASYTSFLHPITTHKLWNDVAVGVRGAPRRALFREEGRARDRAGWLVPGTHPIDRRRGLDWAGSCSTKVDDRRAAPKPQAYRDLEHFETPFVVKFHRHSILAEPQVGCRRQGGRPPMAAHGPLGRGWLADRRGLGRPWLHSWSCWPLVHLPQRGHGPRPRTCTLHAGGFHV